MKNKIALLQVFQPDLRTPVLISLILNLMTALMVAAYINFAQPQLPLFYSLSDTQQILQTKLWFFLLPALSLFISLITMVVITVLDSLQSSVLKLYTWASVSCQIVLLMITIRIIYITI